MNKKSEILYREKIEIESICNNHEEEHKDCVISHNKKLNARKNKKNKASEHFTY
jgi:hypothetical protein